MEFEIGLRLLLAAFLGGIIGLEREVGERPAGFRTHILVSLGSCLMVIVSFKAYENIASPVASQGDPMRLASNVITGIGFLGAGAIIRMGTSVRGLTTAATLWTTCGLGMATGVGLYWESFFTAGLLLLTLVVLQKLERHWNIRKTYNTLKVVVKDQRAIAAVYRVLCVGGKSPRRVEIVHRGEKIEVVAFLVATEGVVTELMETLLREEDVEKVESV